MGIKAKYTLEKGLHQTDNGAGFEIAGSPKVGLDVAGPTRIVGGQPRTGTDTHTEVIALTVTGSMGVEVSDNSSMAVRVPRQSQPALHVGALTDHVRVGIGCKSAYTTLHVSSSMGSGGILLDGNPGEAVQFSFRKQHNSFPGGQWSIVHRADSTPVLWMWGYDGTTYKNVWKFDHAGNELSFNPNDAYSVIFGATGVEATAQLEVSSTTKGFLPPRMNNTQRNAITSPATGLMIYNTTSGKLNFYNGSNWEEVTSTE